MRSIKNVLSVALIFGLTFSLVYAGGKKDKKVKQKFDQQIEEDVSVKKIESESKKSTIRAGFLNGPTGVPFAYLCENVKDIAGNEVVYEKFATPQMEIPKLLNGELDIGVLPVNLAAKVYNASKGEIVCLGVCGNGNLYLIAYDDNFSSFEDLKGKTLYVAGKGATPEYITRYLLSKKGLAEGEGESCVNLDYSIPTSDLPAAVISRRISYAVLPEPFATVAVMKNPSVKKVLDLQKEYSSVELSESYPLSVLVASSSFAKKNPELCSLFTDEVRQSIDWILHNVNKAGVLVQSNLGIMAPIASKSIPNSGYLWVDAVEAKDDIESLLSLFLHFDASAIGNELPEHKFYFTK